MSATNFAAAQQRVLGRRRARETESRAVRGGLQSSSSSAHVGQRLSSRSWLWNTLTGREGNRPAFRVGQVDAELLDEELLDLLKGQLGEGLKYYGVSFPLPTDLLF